MPSHNRSINMYIQNSHTHTHAHTHTHTYTIFLRSFFFDMLWVGNEQQAPEKYRSLLRNMQVSFVGPFSKRDVNFKELRRVTHTHMCVCIIVCHNYGWATLCRLPRNIRLFCKRALHKQGFFCIKGSSAKETCISECMHVYVYIYKLIYIYMHNICKSDRYL